MSFWEKGYFVLAGSVLIAGTYYFFNVWQASIALGAIAPPTWSIFIAYVVLQLTLSVAGFALVGILGPKKNDDALPAGGLDERDRIVKVKSEASAGHIAAAGMYLALGWFMFHSDGNLLFHSIMAGIMVTELSRCAFQVYNYNRAY